MAKDTADYEASEHMAIESGKKALRRAPWLFNRAVSKEGFFVNLRKNDAIHPKHFSVNTVDGVGTKLFFGPWSGNYRLQPIDGLAMSANDMATLIQAYPSDVILYIACQTPVEEEHMGEIMDGFVDGFERLRIPNAPYDMNAGKFETASLDEMISLGVQGKGWDVGVTMYGFIEKDKLPNLQPQPGHVIVGVSSTGLHSNGYTSARHVLFTPDVEYRNEWKSQYKGRFKLDDKPDVLEGETIMEAMQRPTAFYLVESALIGQKFDNRDIYGVNITGNGLFNFNRAGAGVGFIIDDPLPPLPIHKLLMEVSGWDIKTAYTKQNGGMGFAYVVPDEAMAREIVALINERGENTAKIVGKVVESKDSQLVTMLNSPGEEVEEFAG